MSRPRPATLLVAALLLVLARGAAAFTVVVTADKAPVQVGAKVIATVTKGQTFQVVQQNDLWYGIHVQVGDKTVFGWIHSRNCEVQKPESVGTDPLEAEAEKEFAKRKAEAEKLVADNKFSEAIELFDNFPKHLWGTKAAKKAMEYANEIEKRGAGRPEDLEGDAEREFQKRKEQADKLVQAGKLADAVQVLAGFPAKYEKTKAFAEAQKIRVELAEKAGEKELERAKALADKLAGEGKLDDAIKVIDDFLRQYEGTKAVEAAGRHRLALLQRAHTQFADFEKEVLALIGDGKFDEALAKVKALEDQKPPGKEAYLKAARAFVEGHQKAAATPDAPVASDNGAADVYSNDPEFTKQFSRILNFRGPEGVTSYTVLVRQGDKIVQAKVNLPKPEEQITLGEQLAHTYPWSPNVPYYLAKLYARAGQLDKAVANYAEARALDRGRTIVTLDSFVEAARVLVHAKRYPEAIELLKKALARRGDDFIALTALGRAHLAAGARAEAAAAFERSLKANPVQPEVQRLLAQAKGQKPPDPHHPKLELTDLIKQVEESCLIVMTTAGTTTRSSGSGYVISSQGLVATNFHVIAPGGRLTVRFKRKGEFVTVPDLQLVLGDPVSDIAILKLDARAFPLKPLPLGTAQDVASGEDIVVIGNPGVGGRILDYTVTKGIISNRDREMNKIHYFQTDAAVNPGNSGGPLFNMAGQVIGMVTLKATIERTGFALHIDQVKAHFPHCFPEMPAD